MKTVKVNIKVNGETEKAYSTVLGWIPKSAVGGTLSKYNKTTDIVEIASWLVSKNESIQENAKQAKEMFLKAQQLCELLIKSKNK